MRTRFRFGRQFVQPANQVFGAGLDQAVDIAGRLGLPQEDIGYRTIRLGDNPESGSPTGMIDRQETATLYHRPVIFLAVFLTEIAPVSV